MRNFMQSIAAAAVAAAIAFGAFAGPGAQAQPNAPASSTRLFEDRSSGKLGATKLYLIPGLTAPGAAWDEVRPAFEASFEVHTLSLAGFGGVAPQRVEGSFLATQADAIAEHLKADGARGAVLVGHSLGGALALMVAQRVPKAIDSLVIVDSVPFLAQWMSGGAVQTLDSAKAMAGAVSTQMGTGAWENVVQSQRSSLPIQSKDPAFQEKIAAWMLASDQQTVASAIRDLLATDLRPLLPGIRQRVLVLMSYDAGFTPAPKDRWLSFAQAQYAGLANAEVRLIEGSRHWIQHDQAQALSAAVLAFTARAEE